MDEYIEEDEPKELSEEELKKQAEIEQEKKRFLSNVIAGILPNTKEKVGLILNRYPSSRNSDIDLAWNYWATFESDKFNGESVNRKELFALTRMNSLTRARAKIQNEYKLFQADDSVKKYRGVLEEEKKTEAIYDKPPETPVFSVFIDESGKTQDYLSVGSLWMVGATDYSKERQIIDWMKNSGVSEFHFKEVSKKRLNIYQEFFTKFISLFPTAGFKIIIVRNTGHHDTSDAITDLTFHLLNKGVKHENDSGRAPLPRILQVWLDEDEKGSDSLKLENVKERLAGQKVDKLYLGDFLAVSSKSSPFIQAVDLFTAAVNRKIHKTSGNTNEKDELANFVLNAVDFDINQFDKSNEEIDNSTLFNLSDFEGWK